MGYVIAAYSLVFGGLLAYGVWIQRQRRALMHQPDDAGSPRPGRSGP